MASVRKAFRALALYAGYESTAEYFNISRATVERKANTNTPVDVLEHVLNYEDHLEIFPFTVDRFRAALQAMNHDDNADDVEAIHAALMRIKARSPEHFGAHPRQARGATT